MKTFKINEKLTNKYRGSGAALAKIKLRFDGQRRFLDELIDFDYATKNSEGNWVAQAGQTVDMTKEAGVVLGYTDIHGNDLTIDPDNFLRGYEKMEGGVIALVVVNLSNHEACLA